MPRTEPCTEPRTESYTECGTQPCTVLPPEHPALSGVARWRAALRDYSARCTAIEDEASHETLRRYHIYAAVVLAFNLAYVAYFSLGYGEAASERDARWVGLVIAIHGASALAMLVLGGLIHRCGRLPDTPRYVRTSLELAFGAASLSFGVALSLADQLKLPSATNFSTVCLMLGMTSLVRPRRALIMFVAAYAAFFTLAPLVQPDAGALAVIRSHALSGALISAIASAVVWHQYMRSVLLRRELAHANHTLAEQQQELAVLATRDSLTGLYVRREFTRLAHMELARAKRTGRPSSLVMVDIDHFKQVNDRHGHPAGDEVLRQVADRLGRHLRATDILARMGGEEFVALLPDTDRTAALDVAEKLRDALRAQPLKIGALHLPVTASFGVSTAHGSQDDAFEPLYAAADAALYRAKQSGRDRVCDVVMAAPEAAG